jgi:hypothetical protein
MDAGDCGSEKKKEKERKKKKNEEKHNFLLRSCRTIASHTDPYIDHPSLLPCQCHILIL